MIKQPHKYRGLSPDKYEELFSNFLIDSWSYSKLDSFSRNEKVFEMSYIYRNPYKSSASAVAGNAYHSALQHFFEQLRDEGEQVDLAELQTIAFEYIDEIHPAKWKIQKTTPTVEECKIKANKNVVSLLEHFFTNAFLYLEDMAEILAIEVRFDEFLTVNGVDIPLPCHGIIDLVIRTNEGKIVVIDHKSKAKFTDEKELKFTIGKQAVTYANGYETHAGVEVDEVWFIENKTSKNRDKSIPQLSRFEVVLDKGTRRLYESMLYEPLRRMVAAVSDPDYVYLMNDSDNFVDKAEVYEFWAQTMIAEVEDFPIPEKKRDLISKRLKKIRDASSPMVNPKVIKRFKENAAAFIQYDLTNKNMSLEAKIEHTLKTLGILSQVAHKFDGYSSDTFLLEMSAGVNISSIHRYKLDIANALNVASVRMDKNLYVHGGKSYVSIEAAKKREKDLLYDTAYLEGMKIPIGKTNFGEVIFWDLNNQSTPHVLICGATGSGKSVCINSTIEYAKLSGVKNIEIMDPKFEFNHLKNNSGVNVYQDIESIEKRAKELVEEMNYKIESGVKDDNKTLVILDEFADAFLMARKGKDLDIKEMVEVGYYKQSLAEQLAGLPPQPKMAEKVTCQEDSLQDNLQSLLQKGRSSGFRLVLATQRASAKIISGDLKVNLPVQICFRVPKEIDSKVVLDEGGAEALSGMGDGLINSPEYLGMQRFQGFYKA